MLMIEQRDSKHLANKLTETTYTTIPSNYLEMAELSGGFLGSKGVYPIDLAWTLPTEYQLTHVSLISSDRPNLNIFPQWKQPHILSNGISTDIRLIGHLEQASFGNESCNYLKLNATNFFNLPDKPAQHQTILPNNVPSCSLPANNYQVTYQQRWQREIASRFQESKKRFPEFFPCFELLDNQQGLQYSIHFEPLTGHAKALTEQTPLFPHQKDFKPIDKLWQENGSSELDVLFERFPTQLTLLPPKQSWGTRMWELFLVLVNQAMELRHINFLSTRKA